MLNTGNATCPDCGGELEELDCLDIEDDVSRVHLLKNGKCSCCGKHYMWSEVFVYEGYTTPEQEDDEPEDIDDDCGFNPYTGCYTYDC